MPNPDVRIVRGLSIAAIVLSAIALAGCALLFVALSWGGIVMNDPHAAFIIARNDPEFIDTFSSGLSGESAVMVTMLGIGFAAIGTGMLFVCHALVLVAGIVGLRACTRPQSQGAAFAWAIIGAISSLLCGNLITMTLLIIAAIYLNRLRTPQTPANPHQPPIPPQQPMPLVQQPPNPQIQPPSWSPTPPPPPRQ